MTNNKAVLNLSCYFCNDDIKIEFTAPDGWIVEDIYQSTYPLCPKHAIIEEFRKSQCPGCVACWGECGLCKSFAFSGISEQLTESDFAQIRSGICPKRVNGKMSYSIENGLQRMDFSEKASVESGIAMEEAIKEYLEIE